MGIEFVQGSSNNAHGVSSVAVAFSGANTAGNLILVCAGTYAGGTLSIRDSAGNTYHEIQSDSGGAGEGSTVTVWYAPNCEAGGNTVTVSTASGGDIDVIVAEYSGVNQLAASSVATAGTDTVTAGSVTPTTADNVLLLYGYDQTNSGDTFTFTTSPTQTFTQRGSTSNTGGSESSALTDCTDVTAETLTPTVTVGSNSHGLYLVAILLSESGGGGTGGSSTSQVQLTLPGAWVVNSTSQSVQSGWGTTPFTFASTGTLPTGMALQSDGTLTGTPSAAGTFNFTITVTDANGETAVFTFSVSISSANVPVDTSVCAAILYGGYNA